MNGTLVSITHSQSPDADESVAISTVRLPLHSETFYLKIICFMNFGVVVVVVVVVVGDGERKLWELTASCPVFSTQHSFGD
jgi:hypothetical protein